jgi:hypothetical protein
MSLADILSSDGRLLAVIQDRILMLRLVSREIMTALERNIGLQINIRMNDSGVECLTAAFLKKWHGSLYLHCICPWDPDSRWFKEVRDALLLGQLRPLNLLSLSVKGRALIPLVETLLKIGPAIRQLEITYSGNRAELLAAAAPLASFGHTLTMKISFEAKAPAGRKMTVSQTVRLLASNINISSISFRSSQPLIFSDSARDTHSAMC